MDFIKTSISSGIATVMLSRGKVNALTGDAVDQAKTALKNVEKNPDINAVILTGDRNFFSFGFDVPEFLSYSKATFLNFLHQFTGLYRHIFMYPKPVIAALNGHTIAGGCMLALACDRRIMVSGKARISLNEIAFGSSVFAGSTEMLRLCVGSRYASQILYSGDMYSAEAAESMGLVDKVTTDKNLMESAMTMAMELGEKPASAFAGIKSLIRTPALREMERNETDSIRKFVDIWYSDETWENLKNIKIR